MELHFSGECTVRRAVEIKELLLSSLGSGSDTVLSFEKIEEADLSFFLLLHSMDSTCRQRGKKLVMLPNLPVRLARRAAMAGLPGIVEGSPSVH